jgi:hypothetical protein
LTELQRPAYLGTKPRCRDWEVHRSRRLSTVRDAQNWGRLSEKSDFKSLRLAARRQLIVNSRGNDCKTLYTADLSRFIPSLSERATMPRDKARSEISRQPPGLFYPCLDACARAFDHNAGLLSVVLYSSCSSHTPLVEEACCMAIETRTTHPSKTRLQSSWTEKRPEEVAGVKAAQIRNQSRRREKEARLIAARQSSIRQTLH